MDELETTSEVTTPEVTESAPSEPLSVRETLEAAVKATSDRPRDEFGRFKALEQAQEGVQQATESVQALQQQPEQQAPQAQAQAIQPPKSWSTKDLQLFATLPREAQEVIVRREQERDAGVMQALERIAGKEKYYGALDQTLGQHSEYFIERGWEPVETIGQLIQAQRFMDQNPVAGLQWLAQSYGLPAPYQGGETGGQIPPAFDQLYSELQEVKAQLSQREQAEYETRQRSITQDVVSFAQETDANGQPLRPHFDKLSHLIAPIVQTLRAQDPTATNRAILERAYDMAVHANPETRQTVLQSQVEAEATKRREEQTQKAQKAKLAGLSISGAPGATAASADAPKSIRETILQAMNGAA